MAAAAAFLLDEYKATNIMMQQITMIASQWDRACDEAKLSQTDRTLFAGRQFLNTYCDQGLGKEAAVLRETVKAARARISA